MPDPALALPLAHASHWLVWVLYAVPVLAVLVAVILGVVRERRSIAAGEEQDGGSGDDRDSEAADS